MATTPTVSIITPVRNGLPYIVECVESVLSQEFQGWEMLISDNGSTDATRDYLDSLTDPRIKIFKQEKNLGIPGNLNFLFSKARTSAAYILCADDYLLPGGLQRAIDEWSTVAPGTAFIRFNWEDTLTEKRLSRYSHTLLPRLIRSPNAMIAFFVFGNLPGNISNVLVSVDAVRESGGFEDQLPSAGDFGMWAQIGKKNDFVLSDTKTVFVRRHEGVASNYLQAKGELFTQHIAIYEKLIDELAPYYDRKKLVAYFNVEICSFHFRAAIKHASQGQFDYLKRFVNTQSSILWPRWVKLIACLPFALYEDGRQRLAVRWARDIMQHNRNINA